GRLVVRRAGPRRARAPRPRRARASDARARGRARRRCPSLFRARRAHADRAGAGRVGDVPRRRADRRAVDRPGHGASHRARLRKALPRAAELRQQPASPRLVRRRHRQRRQRPPHRRRRRLGRRRCDRRPGQGAPRGRRRPRLRPAPRRVVGRPLARRLRGACRGPPGALRSAGPDRVDGYDAGVTTESRALRPRAGDRAPADWGLGDGQAIPWEYAPAPESRDVVTLRPRYGLFIDGREVQASDGGWFKSVNPATEEVIAEVAKATTDDVDRAIRAARRAQRTRWGNLPGRERAKYLFRIARLLQERSREFAVLESMDSGKPIKESRDVDVPLVANHFWYYAGWADKLEYAFPGRIARPLGVAAQVIPWNFPLLMLAWKIAPALAAGNTVVLKPASTTPLSALLFAEVCQQADLPAGVVNIVPGPSDIGMHLVSSPNVDKVAFTGSTGVGKLIQKATAGTDKALTLELGGKAANIVFEDAALD